MQCATRLEKYFEKEIGKMGRQNQNETEELCKKNFDEEKWSNKLEAETF